MILAGKEIRKLNFGKKGSPVLVILRAGAEGFHFDSHDAISLKYGHHEQRIRRDVDRAGLDVNPLPSTAE